MPPKANCSHDDSRLSCVECGTVICSGCLIQCPVGFRCGTCAGTSVKRPAAASSSNALIVARALLTCVAIGYGFGVLEPFLDLPFIGVFVCFAAGLMAGRVAVPLVTDQRIGNGVSVTVVFGLLIGMSFTQIATVMGVISVATAHAFTSQPELIIKALTAFASALFNPVAFIVAFWRMTAWRI